MTMLLRIAERVINRPLLVHPDKLPLVLGVLQGRIPLGDIGELRAAADARIDAMPDAAQAIMRGPLPGASRFVGEAIEQDPVTGKSRLLPYRRTKEGVAVITVTGSLINRGAWVGSNSGETSYEGIKYQLASIGADADAGKVRAAIADVESPGGEAVGTFETAAEMRKLAAKIPVTAVVNGMAASAAYAIASGATRIVTTPTGISGSIGVVMLHADYSRFLDAKGITPTLIFAGAHKVDGNPFEPLPPGVRDDLQAEVEQFYALFVKTVAAGRKGLSPAAIRATEARTYIGGDAVKIGLADEVGSFESALADITRGLGRATSINPKGSKMENTIGAPAANAGSEFVSLEQHKKGCAEARESGKKEGLTEGAKAAQARIKTILGSEHAKGREVLAQHLAFETDTAADAAVAMLEKAPKAEAAAKVPSIAERGAAALAADKPAGSPAKAAADLNPSAIYGARAKARAATVN